jgi:hypothetical protein
LKTHTIATAATDNSHSNNRNPHRSPSRRQQADVRKVAADSVPYGDSISRNGTHVWAGFDGERLLCVCATAGEARRKCADILAAEESARQLGK